MKREKYAAAPKILVHSSDQDEEEEEEERTSDSSSNSDNTDETDEEFLDAPDAPNIQVHFEEGKHTQQNICSSSDFHVHFKFHLAA